MKVTDSATLKAIAAIIGPVDSAELIGDAYACRDRWGRAHSLSRGRIDDVVEREREREQNRPSRRAT
jgi:hypothetical protein